MPAFRLMTLGVLEVRTEAGEPVEFPAGKPLALLIRLAVSPEPPTRRELVHLLWPRSSMERGLQSVRQALWLIRKTLGEDVLEADEVVRLTPGAVTSDVADLERVLAENRAAEAAALWHGEFLHRFAVADAPEWDRWVEGVNESLARRLAGAVHALAVLRRDTGDLASARRGLERAAEIAPFDSRYREDLVSFLVELRDLRAAEQALADARRVLADPEQGPVLDRLTRRVEQLRSDRGNVPDERLARPDLVGRSAELADLVAVWRRAEKGGKRIVLLTGPAGIGKTRLADELARTVQHEGAAAVTIRAAEVERGLEHGVIASLARALLQMPGAAGISTQSDTLLRGLAPSLSMRGAPSAPGNGEPSNPVALADALADLLGAVAYERSLLLTVDDAGWADPASVTVLARALRTLREGAVMVVLTARTPGGVGGVLRPLESIGADVAWTPMRLRPLSRAETRELVALLVDLPEGAGAARLVDRIHATTGGNPFYVIELIRAFLGERLISTEEGRLVVDLSRLESDAPWPKSVRSLVRRRFERLSPDARALGHLLATIAPREPETAARQLAGLGRRAYSLAVGELVEHGIVAWDGGGLAFTHAELREAAAGWLEEEKAVPVWRRWTARQRAAGVLAVGAMAILVSLRLAGFGAEGGPESAPFGGGDIVVGTADSVLVFRAEGDGDSVRIVRVQPSFAVPDTDRLQVFRTAGGENVWFRGTRTPDRGPDQVRVDPETGAETPVIAGPGDDNLYDISPDGRWIAFGSDDPGTPYEPGVHIARIDGSEPRVLFREREMRDSWSPDGRYLLTVALAPVDTISVVTPGGTARASMATRQAGACFCGGSERVLVLQRLDAGQRLLLWDWRSGAERVVAENVTRLYACSPDGSAALAGLAREGREAFGVLDLTNAAFHPLDIDHAADARVRPTWLADRLPPVPSVVTLLPDSVAVDWGGAESLLAEVTYSDGGRQAADVAWSSADSSVATVSAAGQLTGNRPGTTRIQACTDDWVCATAPVVVRETATDDLLFEDDFATALDARWIPFGSPLPRSTRAREGEPVLFLSGDGVWNDGVLGRDTFSLALGAMLEVEFRFATKLERKDRQTATFCLGRYALPPVPPATLDALAGGEIRESVCFSWPADVLRRYDPAYAYFAHWPTTLPSYAHAPDDLPPERWTHVAIQVLPDGRAFLFVNRRQAATLPVRLEGTGRSDWRVQLSGHSVDTRLEVRKVTLWRKPRY